MNVRDPFNLRPGSLNRPPIATWKPSNRNNQGATANFSPLHHIIRTAATATQSAAADLREKTGEAVQSAQQVLSEAAAAAAAALDDDNAGDNEVRPQQRHSIDLEKQSQAKEKPKGKAKSKSKDEDMSFAVPKNVPSFSNPQRHLEDRLWAASSSSSSSASRQRSSVIGGVQNFLSPHGNNNNRTALPMYKDKPYMYPPGRGGGAAGWRRPFPRRKRTCGLLVLVLLGLVWWTGLFAGHQERAVRKLDQWGWLRQEGEESGTGRARRKVDWLKRRERVVEAMELSWDAYERYAWGGLFFLRHSG
jgi:mannosyl-oligosaccharide alpha-1,2-mannosidase